MDYAAYFRELADYYNNSRIPSDVITGVMKLREESNRNDSWVLVVGNLPDWVISVVWLICQVAGGQLPMRVNIKGCNQVAPPRRGERISPAGTFESSPLRSGGKRR